MWILGSLWLICAFTASTHGQNGVRRPPSITKGPERIVIFRGQQAVTLTCRAEGIPAVTYEWRKNGDVLNLNNVDFSGISDGDITIRAATQTDEGFYQCFARNMYGKAVSTVAHLQRAFLAEGSIIAIVNLPVQEGRPFFIPAARRLSYPTPTYDWDVVQSSIDPDPRKYQQSQRVRSACNGDLYFAYALKSEDELNGRIYKSTVFNEDIDVRSGGSYTRVIVTPGPSPDFPPNITYFSKSKEVALIGSWIEMKCFFSGKPAPTIAWSRPRSNLPSGPRSSISHFGTTLNISNIVDSDGGDYVCTATNANGTANHVHNIRVEGVPIFRRESDGPRDVNVTEGDSVSFNCFPFAIPEATFVWLWNGQPIDVNEVPRRFAFSNDLRILTISKVCRDCVDRESKTDLMVIQCNASNVHGYAFASGYLNVLLRTKVTLQPSSTFVPVDLSKKNRFQFDCNATSDPSTPVTVQWYKVLDQGRRELVYNEPPYLFVMNGNLTLYIDANCSDACFKYLGEYKCAADNRYTQDTVTVRLDSTTAVPIFRRESDSPGNITVTEGDSVSFNCFAFALPEETVVWLWNGQPIDASNTPTRFAFSNSNRSLTIRNVCRDCVDQERPTDLMVIQCNASNVHGYAFAQGYLNVLLKTEVTITGSKEVSVDFLEQKHFIFQCKATSDPSTPPTVRWYKTEPFGDLVRNEPPYILVEKEFLIIMVYPDCSSECSKYLGEYRCIGNNVYSQGNQTITLSYQYRPSPEISSQKAEPWAVWKIIVVAGVIGLVLFLIGLFLGFRSKRNLVTNGRTKGRKQSNPYSIYDRIIYDSVGINPQTLKNTGESTRRAISVYEHPGYDSIDQVLEDMTRGEQHVWSKSSDANAYNGYESIDEPQRIRGRPMLESDCSTPSVIPLEAVTSHGNTSQHEVHGCESVKSKARKIPNSIEQSEAYSDLSRQEINSYADLGPQEDHHYLELCSKEMIPYLDMGQNEVNPYLDMDKKGMDRNLYMSPDTIHLSTITAIPESDYLVLKN